jgi:hypothetical protein
MRSQAAVVGAIRPVLPQVPVVQLLDHDAASIGSSDSFTC